VSIDPRERKWGILNTMNVSYKHSESVKLAMKYWYSLNTVEDIRIMVILAFELSPKCQMQD
jgi:hypothetical protein